MIFRRRHHADRRDAPPPACAGGGGFSRLAQRVVSELIVDINDRIEAAVEDAREVSLSAACGAHSTVSAE